MRNEGYPTVALAKPHFKNPLSSQLALVLLLEEAKEYGAVKNRKKEGNRPGFTYSSTTCILLVTGGGGSY